MPPITCTPCRITIDGRRYRIYKDGSVSTAYTLEEVKGLMRSLGYTDLKQVLQHEESLPRLSPDSMEAKTIRREAQRLRRNRNARERNQAMKDLGLKKTPYGWE